MILSDRYECERDTYGWKLNRKVPGKTKDGAKKMSVKTTYYPSYGQLLKAVLDYDLGDCDTISEVLEKLESMQAQLEGCEYA